MTSPRSGSSDGGVWPGDVVKTDDGREFTIGRMVAYQGKDDCTSWRCTRMGSRQLPDGTWDHGQCYGWHCSACDEPTSSMGHDCPKLKGVTDA